jgi:hypothetical protein
MQVPIILRGAANSATPRVLCGSTGLFRLNRRLLASMYNFIGKRVRVHLYNRDGIALGVVEGRVADVARGVEIAEGMKKDLAYVVDIETGDPDVPYRNSTGEANESWFALQDLEVIEDEGPRLFTN